MTARALVLGGGGVTGIAWELGLLAGLAEAGVHLASADLLVGTSAGSVVGAQLASGTHVEKLYAAQLADPKGERATRMSRRAIARLGWVIATSRDGQKARARMGRMALATDTVPEAERREVIAALLPLHTWPEQRLQITAVDASSGEFTAFDRETGISLVDAVGASCAAPGVWPPISVNGRRWIDGGTRSAANADLAADCGHVVVLAPLAGGFGPITRLADQVAALEKHARVAVVTPDRAARQAIGRNVLDPARRAPAARAGRAQAATAASAVATAWFI